jgi:acyl dehydratase
MEYKPNVGYKYEYFFNFSQDQVIKFAEATGDNNPIHLDDEYAKTSIFGKKILHGMLSGSVFSFIFGTKFPGEGSIYLSQQFEFLRPMYIETEYKALIEIMEIDKIQGRAMFRTEVFDLFNKKTIAGSALIKNDMFL